MSVDQEKMMEALATAMARIDDLEKRLAEESRARQEAEERVQAALQGQGENSQPSAYSETAELPPIPAGESLGDHGFLSTQSSGVVEDPEPPTGPGHTMLNLEMPKHVIAPTSTPPIPAPKTNTPRTPGTRAALGSRTPRPPTPAAGVRKPTTSRRAATTGRRPQRATGTRGARRTSSGVRRVSSETAVRPRSSEPITTARRRPVRVSDLDQLPPGAFERLLRAGQPIELLPRFQQLNVVDPEISRLCALLEQVDNLPAILASGGGLTEGKIMVTLRRFYEQSIIDLA